MGPLPRSGTCQVVTAIGPAGAESLLVKLNRWPSSPEHFSDALWMCVATACCCDARSLQSIDSNVEPFVRLPVVLDRFEYSPNFKLLQARGYRTFCMGSARILGCCCMLLLECRCGLLTLGLGSPCTGGPR